MSKFFRSVWGRLVAYFLSGVFAVLPLVVTAALIGWFVNFIRAQIGPGTLIGSGLSTVTLLGWVVALGIVFGLGVAIVEFGAKRLFKTVIDPVIARIPLIGSIYGTSQQFIEMLDRGDNEKLQGMKPVFCTFADKGGAGTLALLVTPESFTIQGREYQVVIVPTAPVPFGGWLVFVPIECVTPADMSVDGLMSIYVSMGVTTSQHLPTGIAGPNAAVS